jgi:acyl carrier protein
MTKEQIRATILKIIAQIVPDEDLSNLKGDIPIREQIKPHSMDFLYVIVELRKRYGVEVPADDYPQLAISDSSIAYLEPRTQGL